MGSLGDGRVWDVGVVVGKGENQIMDVLLMTSQSLNQCVLEIQ